MSASEAGDTAAPTHLAVPIDLVLRLVAYLKEPKFDFDQAVEILSGLTASPPIRVDHPTAERMAETT